MNTRRDANARRYRPPFSARYYDSFSLAFSSCCVVVFNGVYEREREQLIELQQSRVKANTNRDSLREMICAMVHTQTLAFFYSLLRFLLSRFRRRRVATTITFFFFSVGISGPLLLLRPEYCVVSPLSNPLVTMIPSLSFPFPSCDHHRSLRPVSFLFLLCFL